MAIVDDADLRVPLARVRKDVRQHGLLPFTDPKAPSLVSIVVGSPVAGSWWGHPAGQLIYRVGDALEDDPDLMVVRLWRGKQTLVHRRMWPALARVGTARSGWQTDGLGVVPRRLLSVIDREGQIRSDRLPVDFAPGVQGFRPALRELERRLLVLTRPVHTTPGAHALEAESWNSWTSRVGVARFTGSERSAQRVIEAAARRLTPGVPPGALVPWR